MLIIIVLATTLIYKYLLMPIWHNEILSLSGKLIKLAYPVLDLGYLYGILLIIFTPKIRLLKKQSVIFLTVGFTALFIADLSFAMSQNILIWGFINPLWSIGFIIIASAAFYENDHAPYNNNPLLPVSWIQKLNYLKIIFPYALTIIFMSIASYKYLLNDSLVAGSVISILLIMVRQIFSIIENQKSLNILNESKTSLQKQYYSKELEANLDYLTKLYNRCYLAQSIDAFIGIYNDNELLNFSIFLIDVDHYKKFNDAYGHNFGDKILIEIANIIKNNIRTYDIAGRYGGDEFIVFLPQISKTDGEAIA